MNWIKDFIPTIKQNLSKTFGKETTDHINKMTVHKLKRKHNFEEVNY